MECPACHGSLRQTDYHGINIDECPSCLGRWFDRDELRRAKDSTDEYLRWLDFDPFDIVGPAPSPTARVCPRCSLKMRVIEYETSDVRIDKCLNCHGVWLDHDEFERIVKHLQTETRTETAAEYRKDVARQFAQIFTGPEGPISELRDYFTALNLLEMRLGVERPELVAAVQQIYLSSPFK